MAHGADTGERTRQGGRRPAFAVPDPAFVGYAFDPRLLPAFLIAGLAAALRTVGVVTTCQKINDSDWKRPEFASIKGGVLADGLGCIGAGLLGTMGLNTGPSLVGVSKASGATSRCIAFACAGLLVLFAFVPKIAALFLMLPLSVERATSSTLQVLEHLAAAHLVQGATRAAVSYNELQLVVEITYEGVLLTLPNVGVRHRIFVEEESFSYGLADFLTGVYPDRMESSARGNRVTLRLVFGT
jgi:hypothetical protein